MLRRALLLAAVMSFLVVTQADAAEWAEKMFNSLEYDFGVLARGAKAEHRFRIENRYEEEIRIESVRSSCGCSEPRLTSRTIESGKAIELVAEFNTIKFKGQHSATITVTFASPFGAEVRLKIQGFVRGDVVFEPGRIEFGSVETSAGVEKIVRVSYAGRDDWKIVDVRSSNENFEVGLDEQQRTAGRVDYELRFRLKKGVKAGYINDRLTLVTNDPEHRLIPLAVEGRVTDAVSVTVSPTVLRLGKLKPGQSVTKQLVVRGSSPFRITSVDCDDDECFKFVLGKTARTLHLIPVRFTAPDETGTIHREIQITAEGTSVRIPTITAQAEVE
ncbi:MAG: DUF1573 domain-containing protein [Pirellulales bacterium]